MRELKLKGGPHDGATIDLDKICNGSNADCPIHGRGFVHGFDHNQKAVVYYPIQHDYDAGTGEYKGEKFFKPSIELPDPNDSWAIVELHRWQYGELPQPTDMRKLDVSIGLMNLAKALDDATTSEEEFPPPFSVASVLRYAAKLIKQYEDERKAKMEGVKHERH